MLFHLYIFRNLCHWENGKVIDLILTFENIGQA